MRHPIQIWREARNISQAEAAMILGSSQGAISHIEVGRNDVARETARRWEERSNGELSYADLVLFEWHKKAA